jgi:hypothetical protein
LTAERLAAQKLGFVFYRLGAGAAAGGLRSERMHPARQPKPWSFVWVLLGVLLFVPALVALYWLLHSLLVHAQ